MATILYAGTAGSDDPTRASIPFHLALGAIEAGHKAEVALIGEATYLMKNAVAEQIRGVGVPVLTDLLSKAAASGVDVFV
jgi:uncharacterized protein involved in oxidation of intracellular sulfur